MKRKIAILLAAVMTTAMLPMNVMASSSNSVNRIDSVKKDDTIKDVQLKIEPKASVASGASIILEVQNGEFDKEKINFDDLQYTVKGTSYDWDYYLSEVADKADEDGTISDNSLVSVLKGIMDTSAGKTDQLPYKIKRLNDHEVQVYLAQLPDRAVDTAGVVSNGKPYYLIPIKAVATSDEEDVKIVIDDNGTSISSTTHTVAKTSSDKGSTRTTVAKIATGYDTIKVDEITVKESVKDTFEQGKVKVRVNGGFKIVNEEKIVIEGSRNIEGKISNITVDDSGSYFTFDIPEEWTNTKNAAGFTITGLEIEPNDEDKNWGDVNITISGSNANITKETIKVGERVDYGFTMEVKDEVPTIISGRTYLANDDLDEDDFESATVLFKETAQDTWISSRKLEFTVPEGVKIVDVEYDDVKRIRTTDKDDSGQGALEGKTAISGKGHVLKINKNLMGNYGSEKVDGIQFEMNLYLSIDADFTGDVTLAVAGAGLAADTLEDVTIATAVAPIEIAADSIEVNMGYQEYNVSDITITEVADGALLDDEEVVVAFDDKKFGNGELGFNDTNVEYSVDGEVEIDNFEVYNGAITFDIDKPSYSEPSSITISNLTVGTTRSIPYGSYDLKIGGSAIINNYKDKIEDVYDIKFDEIDKTDSKGKEVNEDRAYFDTHDGYTPNSETPYLTIKTETNTLDGVVEVTKGEQVMKYNGKTMDMGVAPYMQESSGSMLVPLRFVSLALGVDDKNADSVEAADSSQRIYFDGNTKTATIVYGTGASEKIIQFQAGNNTMVVNGTSIPMEFGATPVIENQRMFVPIRALGTALSVPVSWDAATSTARYN